MEKGVHEIRNPLAAMELRLKICEKETDIKKIRNHLRILKKNRDMLDLFLMCIKDSF